MHISMFLLALVAFHATVIAIGHHTSDPGDHVTLADLESDTEVLTVNFRGQVVLKQRYLRFCINFPDACGTHSYVCHGANCKVVTVPADAAPDVTGVPGTADTGPGVTGVPVPADAAPDVAGVPGTTDTGPGVTGVPDPAGPGTADTGPGRAQATAGGGRDRGPSSPTSDLTFKFCLRMFANTSHLVPNCPVSVPDDCGSWKLAVLWVSVGACTVFFGCSGFCFCWCLYMRRRGIR